MRETRQPFKYIRLVIWLIYTSILPFKLSAGTHVVVRITNISELSQEKYAIFFMTRCLFIVFFEANLINRV